MELEPWQSICVFNILRCVKASFSFSFKQIPWETSLFQTKTKTKIILVQVVPTCFHFFGFQPVFFDGSQIFCTSLSLWNSLSLALEYKGDNLDVVQQCLCYSHFELSCPINTYRLCRYQFTLHAVFEVQPNDVFDRINTYKKEFYCIYSQFCGNKANKSPQ